MCVKWTRLGEIYTRRGIAEGDVQGDREHTFCECNRCVCVRAHTLFLLVLLI